MRSQPSSISPPIVAQPSVRRPHWLPRFGLSTLAARAALIVAATALTACEPGPRASSPATAASIAPASPATPERPNIIFIISDDQAPDTLGCEGNQVIRTPNIDRLAAEGVRFSRAYVAIPQCAPSRAAILTGRYPHETGVIDNDDARLPDGAVTLAHVLGRAGYRCGLVGKWHLGNPTQKQAGFDDWWVASDVKKTERGERYRRPVVVWNGEERKEERYLTEVDADAAIQFIERGSDRPFFLWLAFHAPHAPITPHPAHRYERDAIPVPPTVSTPPAAPALQPLRDRFDKYGWAVVQKEKAEYYSMISAVDAAVGQVVEHLRRTGRESNTLVAYSSDNGWFMGEYGLYSKGPAFYETQVRTPLIFWQPGTVPAGQVRDAVVTSLDYFPTLARRAGGQLPPGLPGCDLWPVIVGGDSHVRHADGQPRTTVFLEYLRKQGKEEDNPMLGLIQGSRKLIWYLRSNDELFYDLSDDPLEERNLAIDEAPSAELHDLRAELRAFKATIRPPYWE